MYAPTKPSQPSFGQSTPAPAPYNQSTPAPAQKNQSTPALAPPQYNQSSQAPPTYSLPSASLYNQQSPLTSPSPLLPNKEASTPPPWVNVPPQSTMYAGQWSTGLCDCTSDVSNCCITCWCPCITLGQIAEIADRGTTSCGVHGVLYTLIAFTGFQFIYSCMYRTKMRHQYMLPVEPCNDCLVHCCCDLCALCQEYRELKNRGFDMSLGWHGNVEKQNHLAVTPPFAPAGMKR